MRAALNTARAGAVLGESGIGAVVLDGAGRVVANRHDEVYSSSDPTAHASLLALRDAARELGSWRLLEASLVVTLEPCVLCAGGALSARIARVVLRNRDPSQGALGSRYSIGSDPRLNHQFAVVDGVLEEECPAIVGPG